MAIDYLESSAEFSACGRYRYSLKRRWTEGPTCMFLMLNPSTADASLPDPTITRCIGFARQWGYGALLVGNLFALRSTSPAGLKSYDPFGPGNDGWLLRMASESACVVAAWGNHGKIYKRSDSVRRLMASTNLMCLDITKSGEPKHPLYCRQDITRKVYREAWLLDRKQEAALASQKGGTDGD